MNEPEMCQCCTCGYEWRKGQSGAHSCSDTLFKANRALKDEINLHRLADGVQRLAYHLMRQRCEKLLSELVEHKRVILTIRERCGLTTPDGSIIGLVESLRYQLGVTELMYKREAGVATDYHKAITELYNSLHVMVLNADTSGWCDERRYALRDAHTLLNKMRERGVVSV